MKRLMPKSSSLGNVKRVLCLVAIAGGTASLHASAASGSWVWLFNGGDLNAWRNYQAAEPSAGWQIVDGNLTRVGSAGDLITRETYADFELELEWRVAPGGNSGIFFRADETQPRIYLTAPELQILDDAGHRDGNDPRTSAGSNYALHPVPRGIVKSAGEWNHVRLRVDGNVVTHWLNDVKVVEYELGSADWRQRVAASKFADWPRYGSLREGHIGLQDHGDEVAFRHIRIRRLSPVAAQQ